MHLTTEQKILLHLHRYCRRKSEWEAPYELSQAGISAELHLPQSSVSRSLSSLEEKGLIEESALYIRGERRKKKAYFPSPSGMKESGRLIEELEGSPVNVAGRGDMSIRDVRRLILKEKGLDVHPLQIYLEFSESGAVNVEEIEKNREHVLFHVPERKTKMYGRSAEMEAIKERIDKSKILVIKGMAGMGKTTLLAEIAHDLSKSRDIFWYRFREGRGLANLKRELNEFLRASGRRPVEKGKGTEDFHYALADTDSALMFDDLHVADSDSLRFVSGLCEKIISEPCRTKVLAASREDVRLVKKANTAKGLVFEMSLGPIKMEELAGILPGDEIETAYDATGGIPLFIELYRNTSFRPSDAKHILKEEVLNSLSDEEKRALEALSVHRVPVYPDALGTSPHIVDELRKKLLVFETEDGKIDSHDLIKEAVYGDMDAVERMEYHTKAAEYYLSPWRSDDRFEAVYHLQACNRWVDAGKEALHIASEYPVSPDIKDTLLRFRDRMDLLPKNIRSDLMLLTGDILGLAERWGDAIEYYSMAEKISGKTTEIEERIAKASAEMQDWKTGIDIEESLLKKARKKGDRKSVVRHLIAIGNIRMKEGDFKKAEQMYREAEGLLSSGGDARGLSVIYNNIGTLYLRKGQKEEARSMLEKAVKISKLKSRGGLLAAVNLAYLMEVEGDYEGAAAMYRKAMSAGEKEFRLLEHLVNVLMKLERYDEAISLLEREKKDGKTLNLMADVYRASGRAEDAIRCRKISISMEKSVKKSISLVNDLLAAGKASEALKAAEDAEKELLLWDYEERAELRMLKGDALYIAGDKDGARDNYLNALEIADENAPALSPLIERRLDKLHSKTQR